MCSFIHSFIQLVESASGKLIIVCWVSFAHVVSCDWEQVEGVDGGMKGWMKGWKDVPGVFSRKSGCWSELNPLCLGLLWPRLAGWSELVSGRQHQTASLSSTCQFTSGDITKKDSSESSSTASFLSVLLFYSELETLFLAVSSQAGSQVTVAPTFLLLTGLCDAVTDRHTQAQREIYTCSLCPGSSPAARPPPYRTGPQAKSVWTELLLSSAETLFISIVWVCPQLTWHRLLLPMPLWLFSVWNKGSRSSIVLL